MATSSTTGGGFLVGVIYGLIVSTALYFGLSYVFPFKPDTAVSGGVEIAAADSGPAVMGTMDDTPASSSQPAAPDIGTAPDIAMPEMAQPDTGANDSVTIGGAGDSAPTITSNAQIAGDSGVNEPAVETVSAAVPDIGAGTQETAVPSTDAATAPTAPVQVASSQPLAAPSALAETASGPAVEVFASAFIGDTSKPLLAIVLQDTLEASLEPLIESGLPITFALPADVDSSMAAQSIRGAGFEVVALIPDDASRTDSVAENIERYMKNVPVAVALMDSSAVNMMLNRDAMQTVIETSKPSGLGLVAYSKNGELVARAQAEQGGVPFGSALQITEEFQDEDLIIQALNQAAFVAGTNGRAIIFAKTNPSTINAILRWSDSARADQIQIVPISLVLQRINN